MLRSSLDVLELHVLKFLDHALIVCLRLLEHFTANSFLSRREHLMHKEIVALKNPGKLEQSSQDHAEIHREGAAGR